MRCLGKMRQLFYVFDEHTDVVRECLKKGLKPCGNTCFDGYVVGDTKYILVSPNDCYSGWAVTLMALPCLGYDDLIKLIETSKVYDEIVGSIGVLLKNHKGKFVDYLSENQNKKIKKVILRDIVENSTYVSRMQDLIEVCRR